MIDAAPTPERPRQEPFLTALEASANVSGAARAAGIDRWTAYDRRRRDPGFAAAWDDAMEAATDALEAKARERAMAGLSDTLLIFLLKAHRPERFRENARAEHAGASGAPRTTIVEIPPKHADPEAPGGAAV